MRVVLFDIDGTLLSSGGAGKAALEAALVSAFDRPADLAGIPLGGRTDRVIARDVLVHWGIEFTPQSCDRYLQAYLGHLPAMLESRPGRVLPGVLKLLEALLAQPDVAVGLLTGNVVAGAQTKLSHYGLWGRFAFGGYGDRHLDRDDVAQEALSAAEGHTGRALDPDHVWVIGDTPHDVACARSIGARALGVATGSASHEDLSLCGCDLLVRDLSDPRVAATLGLA